jgi:hypothetical protein
MDLDVEDVLLVPGPAARLARHEHVGQEHHFHPHMPGAFTLGAASIREIERERGRGVAPLVREWLSREQLANFLEGPDVGDRVRPRRPPNRGLIDEENPIEMLPAGERREVSHRLAQVGLRGVRSPEPRLEVPVEHVVQQRALAGSRHAGHGGHGTDGDIDIDAIEVV